MQFCSAQPYKQGHIEDSENVLTNLKIISCMLKQLREVSFSGGNRNFQADFQSSFAVLQ